MELHDCKSIVFADFQFYSHVKYILFIFSRFKNNNQQIQNYEFNNKTKDAK